MLRAASEGGSSSRSHHRDDENARLAEFETNLLSKLDYRIDRLGQNTIVHLGAGEGGAGGWALVIAPVGAAALYGYSWYKGWGYDDFAYVSKRAFEATAQTVSTIHDGVEGVSERVKKFKAELLERLYDVQSEIGQQIEESEGKLRLEVANVDDRLQAVDGRLQGKLEDMDYRLQDKLDDIDGRVCVSNKGIHLLCDVLSDSIALDNNNVTPAWRRLREFTDHTAAYLHDVERKGRRRSSLKLGDTVDSLRTEAMIIGGGGGGGVAEKGAGGEDGRGDDDDDHKEEEVEKAPQEFHTSDSHRTTSLRRRHSTTPLGKVHTQLFSTPISRGGGGSARRRRTSAQLDGYHPQSASAKMMKDVRRLSFQGMPLSLQQLSVSGRTKSRTPTQ